MLDVVFGEVTVNCAHVFVTEQLLIKRRDEFFIGLLLCLTVRLHHATVFVCRVACLCYANRCTGNHCCE